MAFSQGGHETKGEFQESTCSRNLRIASFSEDKPLAMAKIESQECEADEQAPQNWVSL